MLPFLAKFGAHHLKALLLAAGQGTRLRPITKNLPKCLVPFGSKPLLQIWLELMRQHGVDEVLINTHYLPDPVQQFTESWSGPPTVRLAHEEILLGSAGTILHNWSFVSHQESFLVCYADNLTDVDLTALNETHRKHNGLVTMTLFSSTRPKECGIAEMNSDGLVLSFQEKPNNPKSTLANGGVYIMRAGIRSFLPLKPPSDIGFDLLPRCLGQMYGWVWHGLLMDVGNPDAYALAQEIWNQRQHGFNSQI